MRYLLVPFLLTGLLLGGCASSVSGSVYTRGQTRSAQEVELGTVESVRDVLIEGTKTGVGSTAGAVIGGVSAQQGYGKTGVVTGVLGAVVGGIAGAVVEEGVTRQKGYEITVKLDNGRAIAVVQAADEDFKPGERVRILHGSGTTRVTH
jgi:outer membrane lipoprotein SlyB